MRLLNEQIPIDIYNRFNISGRSSRLLYPKFLLSKIKNNTNSFVLNASKILNYLYGYDIPYHLLSTPGFKKRLKNHLLSMQNFYLSVKKDVSQRF